LQFASITLLTQKTRLPRRGRVMYAGSAAVLVSELVKLPFCLALVARDEGGLGGLVREVREKVFVRWRDTLLMGVPAVCFGFQNQLFFIALSNLSAGSYQIWAQAKTLTTAFFFVTYLGGALRRVQWVALALLTVGVSLVQYSDSGSAAAVALGMKPTLGVLAVLASCVLSGFANVYTEGKMKSADCSLWVRNVQLGVFGVPQAVACLASDADQIGRVGLFGGFTPTVWIVCVLKALGGILVAAVIKYADTIAKTYATAVAIILTCLLSIPLYGSVPSLAFVQGGALVIGSVFLYNVKTFPWSKPAAPSTPPPDYSDYRTFEGEPSLKGLDDDEAEAAQAIKRLRGGKQLDE
jgi:UDP-sugar transporter A1/2/3